ncbi:MAG TPA: HNH endonuclease signature motif containing protein [Thermoanaerobaculia bacterium]|nr:HNH endonuclease signature motif containing protein [Thermoanaerobaculia bacterium]
MTSAYISKKLRERVAEQAGYRCGYCLSSERIVGLSMELDHLIPQALGGPSIEANLWLACPACNAFKGHRISARDPESGQTVRLFNPREQSWKGALPLDGLRCSTRRQDRRWPGDRERASPESASPGCSQASLGSGRMASTG